MAKKLNKKKSGRTFVFCSHLFFFSMESYLSIALQRKEETVNTM